MTFFVLLAQDVSCLSDHVSFFDRGFNCHPKFLVVLTKLCDISWVKFQTFCFLGDVLTICTQFSQRIVNVFVVLTKFSHMVMLYHKYCAIVSKQNTFVLSNFGISKTAAILYLLYWTVRNNLRLYALLVKMILRRLLFCK